MNQRRVKNKWTVKYEEMSFPFIQKGWVLPSGKYEEFDPFIIMAEDWFKRGAFSDHPHRGFQTITYVVDGRLEHIDNSGNREILEPGDVQYMNAGSGARHAEEAVSDDIAHTLQLWLNLPREKKFSKPYYQNVYSEATPTIEIDRGFVKIFAGQFGDIIGPLQSMVPITIAEVNLEEGASYQHQLPVTHHAFVYVLSGELELGDEHTVLKKHDVATLTMTDQASLSLDNCSIVARSRRVKLLMYSGEPIKETIVPYGPFVMNSEEEIKDAYHDYRTGKFGPAAK
ncbi:pirin family protein [Alkalihalobacillus hemicellulosilyticus]|uniref:Pirin-like protein n=1 Tax=Halalkalibacter hemicellulosilyticusJCM 9152 TaxID=1236971 RepID=W4QJA6_9BACI|nr:pirin-like C-terminal cupin domain-containing protein [Halalkalibacter hemicellulosilyticus]GAE32205.1 pirin-like protein [Halalkalibacter hemicellulosilyticusJCM 9152]